MTQTLSSIEVYIPPRGVITPCSEAPDYWVRPRGRLGPREAADRCLSCQGLQDCRKVALSTMPYGVVQGGMVFSSPPGSAQSKVLYDATKD